jgi:hypothetical protein
MKLMMAQRRLRDKQHRIHLYIYTFIHSDLDVKACKQQMLQSLREMRYIYIYIYLLCLVKLSQSTNKLLIHKCVSKN